MTLDPNIDIRTSVIPPQTTPDTIGSENRGREALAWARDFAIIGGASAFLTPFVIAGDFVGARYLVFAATGGIVGGFLLGLFFARVTRDRGGSDRPLPLWILALLAPLLGGLWGASVGLVAALGLPMGNANLVGTSMLLAAIAGALQLGWLWAGYLFARARKHPTWPVVVAACVFPVIGAASLRILQEAGTRATRSEVYLDPRD